MATRLSAVHPFWPEELALTGLSARPHKAPGIGMTLAPRNVSLETSTPRTEVSAAAWRRQQGGAIFFEQRPVDIPRTPAAKLSFS